LKSINIFLADRDGEIQLLKKNGIKYEERANTSKELWKQLLLNSQGM
jgi:hypothetical protein